MGVKLWLYFNESKGSYGVKFRGLKNLLQNWAKIILCSPCLIAEKNLIVYLKTDLLMNFIFILLVWLYSGMAGGQLWQSTDSVHTRVKRSPRADCLQSQC